MSASSNFPSQSRISYLCMDMSQPCSLSASSISLFASPRLPTFMALNTATDADISLSLLKCTIPSTSATSSFGAPCSSMPRTYASLSKSGRIVSLRSWLIRSRKPFCLVAVRLAL